MTSKRTVRDIFDEVPDIDGLFLFTDGMHSVRSPSHFAYFTGVSVVADRNCLIATPDGAPIILTNVARDVDRIRRVSGIDDVRASTNFADALASIVTEELDGCIGIGGTNRMPYEVHQRLESSLAETTQIDEQLTSLTAEKSDDEIETFRHLGRIADAGFAAVYDTLRPGITEYALAAEVEYAMRQAGAEDNFNLFGTGSHNQLMHSPSDRILREGDTVLCELSPMLDGYVLQICRTISVGPPAPILLEKFALLEEALETTKAAIGPGEPASTVYSTMNAVFEREGYADYCQPPYMRTRGHEFGFGEIGMAITEETTTPCSPGMVLVIHPNQYIPETGYLALGDPILITEQGIETLTETPARLFTKEVDA